MKKDRKYIIAIIVMAILGCAVSVGGQASLAADAQKAEAAKQALVGDAQIITAEGTADGFAGPVTVVVEYAGDVIVGLTINAGGETPDIGGAAANQIKEAILAAHTYEGIDAVSGATYTSNGIVSAIKAAMGIVEYVPSDEEIFAGIAEELLPSCKAVDAALEENVLAVMTDGSGKYVYMTQGVGHYPDHPFKVAVLLNEDGTVGKIAVVYSHETDGFGTEVLKEDYWKQYFGANTITRKSGVEGATKIDTVSGATETSVGLYNCVKAALSQHAAL